MITGAYEKNELDLLLDNLNLDFERRDALMYYLSQKDRKNVLKTLADNELYLYKRLINPEKDSFTFTIFRNIVYAELDLPVQESKEGADEDKSFISQDLSIRSANRLLDKLLKNDISLEKIKPILPRFAKNVMALEFVSYLKNSTSPAKREIANYIEEIYYLHHLGHRFYLAGEITVGDVVAKFQGGTIPAMIAQLIKAHTSFLNDSESQLTTSEKIQNIFKDFEIEKLDTEFSVIAKDIHQQMNMHQRIYSEAKASQLLAEDNIVNVSVSSIGSHDVGHTTTVCFYDDLCFDCDRSREGNDATQGVIIYRVGDKLSRYSAINRLSQSNIQDNDLQINAILTQVGLCDVEEVAVSEASMQLVGNCTWSSNAEMMLRSTAIAKFYQIAIRHGLHKDTALQCAIRAGEAYHKQVMLSDHAALVEEYLNKHQRGDIQLPIDKSLLAIIYYKAKVAGELKVCETIDSHRVFTDELDYESNLNKGIAGLAKVVLARLPVKLVAALSDEKRENMQDDLQQLAKLYLSEQYELLGEAFEALVTKLASEEVETPQLARQVSAEH